MATPQEAFERTLNYIEDHMDEPLTLEELAGVSGLNAFALIRLFARLLCKTPMEYVRLRRLAASIPLLIRGGRIIDVALDAGFEHEQSYIRAFRETYGVTPARFRRHQTPVLLTEVPRITGFTASGSGMLGEPVLLARPAFSMTGRLNCYNYADNLLDGAPLFDGVQSMAGASHIAACRVSPQSRFTHLYLTQGSGLAGQTVTWSWPAGRWALFRYIGLHPLDQEGVRRVRLLASLVISAWYAERRLRWDGQFIERVERGWLEPAYCEVELMCLMDRYQG